LALPEPALAVIGGLDHTKGELTVLAQDHLYGQGVTSAGIETVLVSADAPVHVDWDFESGKLNLVATQQTTLRLKLAASDNLKVNDKRVDVRAENGFVSVRLSEGRHTILGAILAVETREKLTQSLERLLEDGQKLRKQELSGEGQSVEVAAAELPVVLTASVGGAVTDMTQLGSTAGPQFAVAEGDTIHVLNHEGKEIRKLQTEGKIRVLRWWDEPKLLLAGCVDEKLIAFDTGGRRKWVFTSEMDQAVYKAAKTYWFKTAPGHEGIHGLYTGDFGEGQSRCFVGSACTLEILDETGSLVKRTPVFWGPGRKFLLVDGPDGSKNLLISRWPNGNDHLAVVNSKTLAVTGRGYSGVPAGHAYVGGWTAQNRTGLLLQDLDGDGTKEVATAINGTWNRVTVYSEAGRPLHNAQFGPGSSNTPRGRMRDMGVVDLDGDGRQEILVALSEGLVVALNRACQKVWSTCLASPPVSLQAVARGGGRRPWVVVGCDDGTVTALDAVGEVLRTGKVTGRPAHIETLETTAGPVVVLATDKGEVNGFAISE
jgi:outer membrane protein assembly factor BamB